MGKHLKQVLSIVSIIFAIILTCVAITTNHWFEMASPVKTISDLPKSFVYFWKGLYKGCFHIPNVVPLQCKTLQDWKMDNHWVTAVRVLIYISISSGILTIAVTLIMKVLLGRILSDIVSMLSFTSGAILMSALSIYTDQNPTHIKTFLLFGFSYICAWLSVSLYFFASLLTVLSRTPKSVM
ncbi:uncharacterized protein LOC130629131 [Hydractinia symbiolongicarpus]|uniref:uncharacterized protein LOC130629131 n=1 Tax=Hydractinia symbiolongicarpus TaxID=13093 RepID=UPI00254EBFFF|nr:uncharacterized protein LOC130629131 [Hydractinia symbiolongicarpus]